MLKQNIRSFRTFRALYLKVKTELWTFLTASQYSEFSQHCKFIHYRHALQGTAHQILWKAYLNQLQHLLFNTSGRTLCECLCPLAWRMSDSHTCTQKQIDTNKFFRVVFNSDWVNYLISSSIALWGCSSFHLERFQILYILHHWTQYTLQKGTTKARPVAHIMWGPGQPYQHFPCLSWLMLAKLLNPKQTYQDSRVGGASTDDPAFAPWNFSVSALPFAWYSYVAFYSFLPSVPQSFQHQTTLIPLHFTFTRATVTVVMFLLLDISLNGVRPPPVVILIEIC